MNQIRLGIAVFTGVFGWFSLLAMTFDKRYKFTLTEDSFRRHDEASDEQFYRIPRFVSHIDNFAIDAVTQLYREFLPENGVILDLMSSYLSHLPVDRHYRKVVGLGMNDREMANNKQLDQWVVQDLNKYPMLPFSDNEFDGAAICVSIDYLTNPVSVLVDLGRVMKSGAPLVITYSDRYFETKATAAWLHLQDEHRAHLIRHFLEEAGCYQDIEFLDRSPEFGDPLYAVVARAA
jgi:SAM-dependent methyltransferase